MPGFPTHRLDAAGQKYWLLFDAYIPIPAIASYLPGYDGQTCLGALAWSLLRRAVALYLLVRALARFGAWSMPGRDVFSRLALALAIMISTPIIHVPAIIAAVALIVFHSRPARYAENQPE